HVTALNTATQKTVTTTCHVLINAAGILNAWKWPAIPGLQDYKGTLLHSAAWDTTTDLQGKNVGLIGNGSSGIQILPAILDSVKSLTTFIREPTWVAPPLGQEPKKYTNEEIQQFKTDPQHHLDMRRDIEKSLSGSFGTFFRDSEEQNMTKQYMQGHMESLLNNRELLEKLVPEWSVGCRRITPGIGYLEALNSEKVKVVHGAITNVSSRGPIIDDGSEHPVDVLICATGFDTTFKPRFPLVGRSGKALADVWKDEARAYLGIAVNDYPNYFMTLGPNCPIGNGPVLIAIEAEVEYIIKFLSKFQKENIKSFDVRQEPVDDFNDYKDAYMEGTIWSEECKSWYKNGNAKGKIAALWPGSTLHYLETLAEPRYEDWKFTYDRAINRFTYLGNGFSTSEKRTGDLSYYIRNKDDSPIDPCLKGRHVGGPSIEESAKQANNLLTKGDTRGQKIAAVGETVAKLYALTPGTLAAYEAFAKKKGFKPNLIDTAGVQGGWIGNPQAKNTIMWFHGGGYASAAADGHMKILSDLVDEAQSHGSELGGLIIRYDLTAESAYPRQLEQAVAALRYLLETMGKSPQQIIIAGDSAGGNLALALLSHLTHPHPNIAPINLGSESLKGMALISPWVTFSQEADAWKRNAYKDCLSPVAITTWTNEFLQQALQDNYNSPLTAPESWWATIPVSEILVTGGEDEVLVDDIASMIKKLKTQDKAKVHSLIASKEPHDGPLLEMILSKKSESSQFLTEWTLKLVSS
ncbi:flavin-binding monooxygenase, partial [Aureobasidium melanogenum]